MRVYGRSGGRTCVCALDVFAHVRAYACVRHVRLAQKAIRMLLDWIGTAVLLSSWRSFAETGYGSQ